MLCRQGKGSSSDCHQRIGSALECRATERLITGLSCEFELVASKRICAVFFLVLSCIPDVPAAATDLLPGERANTNSLEQSSRQLLLPAPIASDPKWAVTLLAGASAGDDKLRQLLTSPWNTKFRDDYFVGGALSRRLVRFWNYFSIEAELGVGGRFGVTDGAEGWGAIFFRFDGFPWNKTLYTTFAVSTGIDYLSKLPPSETHPGDPTSHLLHYFSPEITFALPEYKQHE